MNEIIQAQELIKPKMESYELAYRWLRSAGKNVTKSTEGSSYVRVEMTVGGASELMQTKFRNFYHRGTGLSLVR